MSSSWSSCGSLPLFFLSLTFLYCFTFAIPNEKASDLITDICSHTQNPSLCETALRSDPRSSGADLKTLAQISIDATIKNAKSALALVQSLKDKAKDAKLKEIYDSCLENYGDGIDDLGECTQLLKSGDFLGVNLRASAALTDADTCDDNFKGSRSSRPIKADIPSEPPRLQKASKDLQDLCDIILVVANRLQGGII